MVTEISQPARKLQQVRTINNLYLSVNFTSYCHGPKDVIEFFFVEFVSRDVKVNQYVLEKIF